MKSGRKNENVWDLTQFMQGNHFRLTTPHVYIRIERDSPGLHFGVRYGMFQYTNNTAQPYAV